MSEPVAIDEVKTYLTNLQDQLCRELADADGDTARFHEDLWTQKNGGGGRTRVLRDGHVFEQAGVNFSHVRGKALPGAASTRHPELAGTPFQAMGVSLVHSIRIS